MTILSGDHFLSGTLIGVRSAGIGISSCTFGVDTSEYGYFVRKGSEAFGRSALSGLPHSADGSIFDAGAFDVDSTGLKASSVKFRLLIPTKITAALSMTLAAATDKTGGTATGGSFSLQLRVKKNQGSALATVDGPATALNDAGSPDHVFHVDLAEATYLAGDYLDFEFQIKVTTAASSGETWEGELLHDNTTTGQLLLEFNI